MDPNNPKTPGVYIQELKAFPNSIVEVETAVPVFIGYTQKADYLGEHLTLKPVQISSMTDYINFFGYGADFKLGISSFPPVASTSTEDVALPPLAADFSVTVNNVLSHYSFEYKNNTNFYLYKSIQLFYQNGGGKCFIISAGTYASAPTYDELYSALQKVSNETDITLISIPDSLLLSMPDYYKLNSNILQVCNDTQSKFALFDIKGGERFTNSEYLNANASNNIIEYFRDQIGVNYLERGAAYFPWLQTSVMSSTDVGLASFDLTGLTGTGQGVTDTDQFYNLIEADLTVIGAAMNKKSATPATDSKAILQAVLTKLSPAGFAPDAKPDLTNAHTALLGLSSNYALINKAALNFINIMPTVPAMAGVYTSVDNNRGVWKAPANVSLNAVIKPLYNFNDQEQGEGFNLNIDPIGGKSINIIRSFQGVGTLVWGARTLNGNSQDWRYVNVRRTMTMIEQSVKLAAQPYVFEPNVANTWVSIECMLSTFLSSLWKQGALAGAVASDAFSVNVGLGKTMTGDDILNGIMKIVVLVAISHPAEFLVFSFEQQMQKS